MQCSSPSNVLINISKDSAGGLPCASCGKFRTMPLARACVSKKSQTLPAAHQPHPPVPVPAALACLRSKLTHRAGPAAGVRRFSRGLAPSNCTDGRVGFQVTPSTSNPCAKNPSKQLLDQARGSGGSNVRPQPFACFIYGNYGITEITAPKTLVISVIEIDF